MFVRKRKATRVSCRLALAFLLTSPLLVQAEHGRDFTGSFKIATLEEGAATTQLTLAVELRNVSGAGVKDAQLVLLGHEPGRDRGAKDITGSFPALSVGYRETAKVQGSFSIPAREYRQWERGAMPNLVVRYSNEAGKQVEAPVELARAR